MVLNELLAWGFLPVALVLLVVAADRLSGLILSDAPAHSRWAATAILAMGLVHVSVGLLGQLNVLSRWSLLAALMLVFVGSICLTVKSRHASAGERPWVAWGLMAITVLGALVTARLLPVWQWDSIGYHLPFVHFVLQHHGFSEIPPDIRYISTYPHNIELGMIWVRAMLPDDRLVDVAQIPYGLAGATMTTVIARHFGASRPWSWLAGAAWLTVPAVFLQLPTNYVDVGTAAALLGALYFLVLVPVTSRDLMMGGLALGLFLGSKPSAPVAVVLIGAVALIRGVRGGQVKATAMTAATTLLFGAEMYAVMWVRHRNPVWPVAVRIGPWTLPGPHSVDELLASGSLLPHATGNWVEKLSVSWLAIDSLPVFDMKLGGLGLLFLVALPLAVLGLVRRRAGLLVVAVFASLLSPDPSIARYVLAFPALVFALGAAEVAGKYARVATWAVAALALFQLHGAWPGLVGDGPPWPHFWSLSDDERRVALGPHGPPRDYPGVWARVASGESVAFDADFEFPGLLWAPDLRYPVYVLPRGASGPDLARWVDERRVRVVAVTDATSSLLSVDGSHWEHLFDCKTAGCAVYARTDASVASLRRNP
jgi:hypothetical protein